MTEVDALSFVGDAEHLLYRLEKKGWIQGRWVEKAGQRRRRYYRLTPQGKRVLAERRRSWVEAVRRIVRPDYA